MLLLQIYLVLPQETVTICTSSNGASGDSRGVCIQWVNTRGNSAGNVERCCPVQELRWVVKHICEKCMGVEQSWKIAISKISESEDFLTHTEMGSWKSRRKILEHKLRKGVS